MELINNLADKWARGTAIDKWAEFTTPNEDLIWKAGHPRQVKDLMAIGHMLDLPVRVVGKHRSKSVELPVGMFEADIGKEEKIYFLTRDNFYNLKLVVISSCPINISYDDVHRRLTQEEYDAEKKRSFDYRQTHKDFDAAKYETDEWFDDWCSDTLLRTDDGTIYRCGTTSSCYYEGIEKVVPRGVFQRYEHGRTEFSVEIRGSVTELMSAMRAVVGSVKGLVRGRRQDYEDLKSYSDYCAKLAAGDELSDYHQKHVEEIKARLKERGVMT